MNDKVQIGESGPNTPLFVTREEWENMRKEASEAVSKLGPTRTHDFQVDPETPQQRDNVAHFFGACGAMAGRMVGHHIKPADTEKAQEQLVELLQRIGIASDDREWWNKLMVKLNSLWIASKK